MDISNKTKRPLKISLPGGKLLRLGPGRIGQIAPQAAEHAAVKKLLDAGEIEIVNGGKSQGGSIQSGKSNGASTQGLGSAGGTRHTGDR